MIHLDDIDIVKGGRVLALYGGGILALSSAILAAYRAWTKQSFWRYLLGMLLGLIVFIGAALFIASNISC